MKRTLVVIVALASLALIPLGRAEEQPKKQAKGKARASQQAATKAAPHSTGTRAAQTKGQKHMAAKPVHSNGGGGRNFNRTGTTQTGVAKVNRAQVKHGQRNVVRENNQFNAARNRNVVVNQSNSRNVVVNTGAKRRFAVVSGNPISFAQARQWNWHQRHDRGWWVAQDYPIVRYGGGYWFWNSGWWYPAYGYDPYYSRYVYDGPIYGYGNVMPWDVTSQVQRTLAQRGYYYGPVDGVLGSMTRHAIARFQIDHGLPETAAIDRPTLQYLGLA